MEHTPVETLYEIGLVAGVILLLMVAYYLEAKTQKIE